MTTTPKPPVAATVYLVLDANGELVRTAVADDFDSLNELMTSVEADGGLLASIHGARDFRTDQP